mmetsp:Transcript_93660/g.269683  ORF Transcript_93660/g.269683 Transcript_93660/m.269683 type:complete len:460 (-) Transcript_93660:81-1460(-)
MPPIILSEEVPYDPESHHCEPLDLNKPLGGHLWWHSLYWTNFPPLSIFDQQAWAENPDGEVPASLRVLNSDNRLAEQYITYGAAREDLCRRLPLPSRAVRLTVECMQYEGARDNSWDFPLQAYIPRRDNHQPNDLQARRFGDNGVMHLGLNAEEFSERVQPVGDMPAVIHIADKAAVENPTWGYYHAVMRIGGWPYRIKRIGTFEGCGLGGRRQVELGICYWEDQILWDLIEGPAEETQGEEKVNLRKGYKFWASLLDLDWLGRKRDERQVECPSVPPEKGYVWFTVVDTITVPSTGRKGVQIRILEEGVVPAWLDLNFMQVFAGSLPLGFLNEMESEGPPEGSVSLLRTPSDDPATPDGRRKVVVRNQHCKLVFDEPMTLKVHDFVDMGWAMHDCCYQGASIRLGPKPGTWTADVGEDEGMVAYKASGPPPLCHGEGDKRVITSVPRSDYPYERRLVE